MVAKLQLSLGVCDYDRTRAVLDGRAPVEGCDIIGVAVEPEEAFHRAFRFQEFDITEMSLSSHTMMTSRGQNDYVAIPAFVSRLFRHSGVYVRTDRGIRSGADLAGKKIGLPEYQITANVWIRGILQDDFGLRPASVHWRRGGLEDAGRGERAPIKLPADIDLQQIPDDKTLSGMLESGELDGLISARAPSCFLRGAPNVDRLFPNYRETEADYFRRTGIFPTMHVIGIRKALVDQHPWLPVSIFKAFIKAKEFAMYELGQIGHLFNSLPWGVAEFEDARKLMGDDYWSYGYEANKHVLETFTRYHHEQGLSARKVAPEELFAESSLDLTKI
ncbi:4,5-dihydroxyphthalate decarboxylase [Bordetella genomosp. 11]|uniref:4,5-dihydroxyphthalate decarboxylase n=1 Tax=Bordetella genomosp. 11 TaxID=1416808 RepID=A0A261UJF2_9BORD|nr:4,5-dihydroxyphthalate decarboxylase [Bordetella genomosp. 11]OZI61003.1 4,5-dihydroxyphthalate decarboxylase [Bordetella genomosp. 11]